MYIKVIGKPKRLEAQELSAKGLSYRQIAAEMGISKTRVHQLITGYVGPSRGKRGLRFTVLTRDNFTCQYCGRKAPDVQLHIDHVKSYQHGGKLELDNLVTSCADCNYGKADILLEITTE